MGQDLCVANKQKWAKYCSKRQQHLIYNCFWHSNPSNNNIHYSLKHYNNNKKECHKKSQLVTYFWIIHTISNNECFNLTSSFFEIVNWIMTATYNPQPLGLGGKLITLSRWYLFNIGNIGCYRHNIIKMRWCRTSFDRANATEPIKMKLSTKLYTQE